MQSFRYLTPEQEKVMQDEFLKVFISTSSLAEATRILGFPKGCHGRWMAKYPEYVEEFYLARDAIADSLEAEAIRRARDGYERPIFQGGVEVGRETVYSDSLLSLLLKGFKPDRYRERVSVINDAAVDAQIKELEERLRAKGIDPDKVVEAKTQEVSAEPSPASSDAGPPSE